MGTCPEGSRWPVTHLSDGDEAPGPGCPGLSTPTPRNLETGRAWGLGVFSTCCWLWGEAQRGACSGGAQEGLWAAGPSPAPHGLPPAKRTGRGPQTPARRLLPPPGPSWRRRAVRHRPRCLISCRFLTPPASALRPSLVLACHPALLGQGCTPENNGAGETHTDIHRIYYF